LTVVASLFDTGIRELLDVKLIKSGTKCTYTVYKCLKQGWSFTMWYSI